VGTKHIFISYKRDDTSRQAERIYRDLGAHYSSEAVFYDLATVRPGADFVGQADSAIRNSNALLLLIGPKYFDDSPPQRRRRKREGPQYAYDEIRAAIDRDIPVVPILVDDAELPSADDWPIDLRVICQRSAVRLDEASWDRGITQLASALDRSLKTPESERLNDYDICWYENSAGLSFEYKFPSVERHDLAEAAHQLALMYRNQDGLIAQVLYRRDHIAIETYDNKRWRSAAGFAAATKVLLIPTRDDLRALIVRAKWTDQAPKGSGKRLRHWGLPTGEGSTLVPLAALYALGGIATGGIGTLVVGGAGLLYAQHQIEGLEKKRALQAIDRLGELLGTEGECILDDLATWHLGESNEAPPASSILSGEVLTGRRRGSGRRTSAKPSSASSGSRL